MQAVHDAAASPQPTRGRVLFVCGRPDIDQAEAGFDTHLTKPATVAAIEEVPARLASPVQR